MQFSRVLQNILTNAVKYTPSGGTITMASSLADDTLVIEISDTGLGIPEKDIPHLFETFYRVDTPEHLKRDGTGLGLAITKTIVEQHDGTIHVRSTIGQGTSFIIRLNLLPAGELAGEKEAA